MAPRLTPAGRGRPTLERLDDRLAPSVTVSLDPVADMFGPQVVTVVARDDSDHAVFGLFDTGASAFGFTTADQDYFTSIGASIPVKVAGGAQAEGIGGTVVGDVSRPGTIFVDGIHAATMIYDQWQIIPRFTFAFGADSAKVGGVQAFLGLAAEAFNSEVPGLTGTPALNPTPAHPAGLAARIDMRAVRLDFSPIFADDFIEVPDLHFVAPGATLAAADGTTEPVRVPLSLVGPDNSAAP